MSETTQSTPPIKKIDQNITPAPGQLQVIKRSGKLASFDSNRIKTAIKKAFIAVEGDNAVNSTRIHDLAEKFSMSIHQTLHTRLPEGSTIHIETIQDQVELCLMRAGEHRIAREYVLYREARKSARLLEQDKEIDINAEPKLEINVNDTTIQLDTQWLKSITKQACNNLPETDPDTIFEETYKNLFNGVKLNDLYKALTMAARTKVEENPQYSLATSRLLLLEIYREVFQLLEVINQQDALFITFEKAQQYYQQSFIRGIELGSQWEILNPELTTFDLNKLASALKPERDHSFQYLGIQTLYDRYFLHHDDKRFETPQGFFMRVAMGLAINEPNNREDYAIEFYEVLSTFDFVSSTPTLFNSGTTHSQLSSCYLTTISDDLKSIYKGITDNALLSKYAGGLGNDWTNVRSLGSQIVGTNGKSQGVVPFLNVADATAIAVNQGGKRKGAVCAYLENWHGDIEEFLELRKNTGDDRRRTHDMNTAIWVPDLFMKRVFENKDWTLFSPNYVPDLHDLYGDDFDQAYENYEQAYHNQEIPGKTIKAVTLWRKMLSMLFETGHPWITFKDPCNIRSPQQHAGVIHSSNLCTEITLNTSQNEIAVCNLGSINLAQHTTTDGLDIEKVKKTIRIAMRMLDNVIDINYYNVPEAKNSNFKHRPVGLGLMGFQDALYKQRISYASQKAIDFADLSTEIISYYAIDASCELAQERGSYSSFDGSLWSQGIMPIDSIVRLKKYRGEYLSQNESFTMDWKALRKKVKKFGMRNSNTMAIAPTATIANITGVTQSIEPTYQNLYVKSNLSGEFTVINPYLVNDLKQLNLWDKAMAHDLKYFNGSIQNIDRIPQDIKDLYKTAFEIEPKWLIDAASRRSKWIDQAQSLNIYMGETSGKKLDIVYRMAWLRGLKTTYYLRSLGATDTEKSTIQHNTLNAVQATPQACSITDPDCEACQ